MENKKIIAIVIGVLTSVCLVLGIVGLLESKKTPKIEPKKNYQVTYKYYLNGVEVAQMPVNPKQIVDEGSSITSSNEMNVEELYEFNTAKCTNNVTYTWDKENWTFTTDNTADSTCSLYFVTTYNVVKVEATNAKITTPAEIKVKRGEDAVIKITPTEGYEFEKAECSNEKTVDWDKDAKELIIRGVTSETSCKVSFVISKFSVEVQVNMGSGSTKVDYEYGKAVEIKNVTPAEEYGNPDIVCTNDQKATWKDNTLNIEKLTDNTKCSITFKKLQSKVSFTATIDVGENGRLESGASSTVVASGSSASWTVRANEGYIIDSDPTCTAGVVYRSGSNPYVIKLENITSDAECTINYHKVTETPSSQQEE